MATPTPNPVSTTTATQAKGLAFHSVARLMAIPINEVTTPAAVGHTHLAMGTNVSYPAGERTTTDLATPSSSFASATTCPSGPNTP